MMNTKSTTKFSTKVVCAGGILRGRIVQSAKAILRFSKKNIARIANAVQVTICLLVSTSVF